MPSWKDLKRFCENDGWVLYKEKSYHWYYRKLMDDGTIKQTRVSRITGEIRYHLWWEIRNKQLHVTQDEFNDKI